MGSSVQKTGKRSALPEDIINEQLVREYDANDVRFSRMDVRNRLKWVRQHLNREIQLPLSAWLLLDELIGLSHDIDWQSGPITVWPSNELMQTWLDVSERSLQILLNRLRRANFIAFIDSPSRQRWGRRDPETGRIIEAYGIDLRPLAQRVPDLVALAERAQQERQDTINKRRTVRALIARVEEYIRTGRRQDAANDNWDVLEAQVNEIAAQVADKRVRLPILEAALEALRPLEEAIKKAIVKLFRPRRPQDGRKAHESNEESGEGESDFTHKTTTDPSSRRREHVEPSRNDVAAAVSARNANHRAVVDHLDRYKITPAAIAAACPGFADLMDDGSRAQPSWSDIHAAAERNRSVLGIAPHAWRTLVSELGRDGAAVALAIVAEKFCRGARGEAPVIARPAGYLYWIARTYADGMPLDLGPKIHALLGPKSSTAA
ncbi:MULTISPECIES: plasmid replication protein RepC [Alphaproteobacteria]|jgi:replication initiation protein RepC|uniref:Replication initiation protein RepC n=1 Tax=Maricaulis virginensis TaxID=144022 RepID=A0A9W6IRD2_9PROT|nr:plasmid replication protein RepC [Maricaulis virginensis]GLK53964.1 hypothetical protein GCM10017621_34720 [Maricaulis virginensis]